MLTTLVPYGTALPETAAPEAIRRVVATRQSHVSDLFTDSISKAFLVAVYIPVIENNAVIYVLSLGAAACFISRILQSQMQTRRLGRSNIRPQWDRSWPGAGTRRNLSDIRRCHSSGKPCGNSDEGSLEVRNLEGLLVSSVFTKSALSGWSTHWRLRSPRSMRSSGVLCGFSASAVGLLSVIALLLAIDLGRRFVAPFAALTAMAESLGRGERVPRSSLGLREAQIVADQMVLAADTLRHHDDEHAASACASSNDSNETS